MKEEYLYIIMADGEGKRWGNYMGVPKHLVDIDGEPLIARTVRQLRENGINNIIITARDNRYTYAPCIPQTKRDCEIDRFEENFTSEKICYLYGDVLYTDDAIKTIISTETDNVQYFGGDWEIFGIKINNYSYFKEHKDKVKQLFLDGEINRCIGWEIYRSMNNIPYDQHIIGDMYIKILDGTNDFDYPEEYDEYLKGKEIENNEIH